VGRTIFAIFDDFPTAQRVATALEREGYDPTRMSVVVPKPPGPFAQALRKDAAPPAERPAPAGGGTLEDITIAGLGPAGAAGPLTAALMELNSEPGGLIGSLGRLGFSEPAARHYYESLRRRQVLVAVESPENRARNAEVVMRRLGARAVEDLPSSMEEEHAGSAREEVLDKVTVPVVEEQLDVGKRQVSRGGVRVNSQIVEQPIEEKIQLREERVSVERRAVNREATEADLAAFKEGSIEIHETIEEPVISKRRRVVEEVIIGRETRERTESITETVRKTQVRVEPLAPDDPSSRAAADRLRIHNLQQAGRPAGEPVPENGPAYRYASDLARDERYQHADWSEIEPHARRGWEEQNEGTWEQFKDAVRSAWDKVSGH